MLSKFYNEDGPIPFDGVLEEELETPDRKNPRKILFPGGLLGPMGNMSGPMYPFIVGSVDDLYEEEEDPNP